MIRQIFFVIVKLTYLIRDFVTNASILVIRFTIFPVFCFAMLKLSSLINFDKLEFTLYVAWGVPEVNWRSKPKAFWSKYSLLCQLFGWVEPSISRLNFKTSNVLLVRKEYINGRWIEAWKRTWLFVRSLSYPLLTYAWVMTFYTFISLHSLLGTLVHLSS